MPTCATDSVGAPDSTSRHTILPTGWLPLTRTSIGTSWPAGFEQMPPSASETPDRSGQTLLRNTAWHLTSNLATLAASLGASVLIARYLGPDVFGLYALLIWIRFTAGMLLDAGFSSAITKFISELCGAGRAVDAETVAQWL